MTHLTTDVSPRVPNPSPARPLGRVWLSVIVGGAVLAASVLPACRTTEGAGRDVEALGDNIADSADKNKPK